MNELKKQVYDAKKELEQLEAELPNFEKLLSENEQEEAKARGSKNYHELTQAKTRVQAARELLEQHHSDIKTARSEVERLEADYRREQILDEMAQHAKAADAAHDALAAVLLEADNTLKALLDKAQQHRQALTEARRSFKATGRQFSQAFGLTRWLMTMSDERIQQETAKLDAVIEALKERAIDARAVRTAHHDMHALSDLPSHEQKPFPKLEHEHFLWTQLLKEQVRDIEAGNRLANAAKPEPKPSQPHEAQAAAIARLKGQQGA